MAHFTDTLAKLLDEEGQTQLQFGKAAGFERTHFNKLLRGQAHVGPGTVRKIASALTPEQAARLIVAYLQDELEAIDLDGDKPAGNLQRLVKIERATPRAQAGPDPLERSLRERLPKRTAEALIGFLQKAEENPARLGALVKFLEAIS